MRHPDERLSELVDGRMDHRTRDRALAHLSHCERCRVQVEQERALRNRLTRLHDAGPVPPDALEQRLLGIAAPQGTLPPPRAHTTTAAGPTLVPWNHGGRDTTRAGTDGRRPPDARPPAAPGKRPRRRRRRWVTAGATLGAAVALVGVMGALGGTPAVDQDLPTVVVPDPDVVTVEHDRSTGNLPFGEPVSVLNVSDPGGGRAG
ncbi:MAG TPA: zf-HC2 domain-containing protein [Jiangellaceae bacterium]|nr:zf-HC2 domain-containing protein [Jiangellaceae bacterium]